LEEGNFIYIDYIGRIKDTGEIFDLTKEEIAKREKIFDPNLKYKPIPVIVGSGLVLKGIEDAIKEMKVGEKRTIEISPEEGFGQRNPEFIKLIPLSVFKEQNVEPTPGTYVTVNRITGKVISIDGGRVRIDFNHPLAGKNLEYEIEIKGKIENPEEKIKAIVSHYFGIEEEDIKIEIKEKEVEIILKKKFDFPSIVKERIANILIKWMNLEKVKFAEIYTK
jgi:FKBP-type peptidyl-prolyl cis-trans isomerase 2